ncbi:MAG: CoA transferase [Candidatus Heimdallarchaeota archaeon]|nr:MAG: CoA transferase [Candidatus Heimdallarchaeota archaeon]
MPLRQALNGIRVLDLTSNLPGPLASQILGDFGADVIKIESPQGDNVRYYPPFIDSESIIFLLLNRNKRSISINLKSKEGLNLFYELVKTCDVVLEGFRPGTTKRMKIDFDTLKHLKQNIIYCSLIGYHSQDTRSGHDLNYVGSAGILDITGPKEVPTPIGVPIADIGGGSLPTVISILAAILQRKEKAQHVTVHMTEQLIPWLSVVASTYLVGLGEPQREEHILSGYNAYYRLYSTKDNRFVSFAPLEAKFWNNFCIAIRREDLIGKQFDSDVCDVELPKIFLQKTQLEWTSWFADNDVPGAPVMTLSEALAVNSRIQVLDHPTAGQVPLIASPFLNQDINIQIRPPPSLGEHTKEILTEIGHLKDYERLKFQGVIRDQM